MNITLNIPLINIPILNIPPLNMFQNIPLNIPIWNKLMLKSYGWEFNTIIKIYIEENKYTEENKYRGNRDSFNFKLAIFHNICGCVNILYKAKAKAFPTMLKGLVLDFFYLNNTINKSFF